MIYIGSTVRAPGLLWPGDLWRKYWDPLDPTVASFTLTRDAYAASGQNWAQLRRGGLHFQVSWECTIGYNDRQAGATCGGPVAGLQDISIWSTLTTVPPG